MFHIMVSSIGVAAGIFVALAILVRDRARSPQTWYLAIAAVAVAMTIGEDLLGEAKVYDAQPQWFGWSYPAFVLMGPLIWLHVAAQVDPIEAGWRRAKPHLIGAIALSAVLIPWALSGSLRWRIDQDAAGPMTSQVVFATLSVFTYLVCAIVQLLGYLGRAWLASAAIVDERQRLWTRRLTAACLVAASAYALGFAASLAGFDPRWGVTATNGLLALTIYALSILAIATPPDPLTAPPRPKDCMLKYAKSALDEPELDRLMAKIEAAVARMAVHRDPGLTLHKLAKAIGARPNDVSQTLNRRSGGFHAWLSQTRVADVQAQLLEGVDVTGLLDAAFAAGFNSKSTFYDAFRRATGLTPAAWRDREVGERSDRAG